MTIKHVYPSKSSVNNIFQISSKSSNSPPSPPFVGEAGTGNVVEAVRHARAVMGAIRMLQTMDDDELYVFAKEIRAPIELVKQTKVRRRNLRIFKYRWSNFSLFLLFCSCVATFSSSLF